MNYGYGPQEMDTAQDLVVRASRRADPPIHDAYAPGPMLYLNNYIHRSTTVQFNYVISLLIFLIGTHW